MSELCRMVEVSSGLTKDGINVLKTKGVNTILSSIEMSDGIYDRADAWVTVGSNVHSLGLKWCVNLDLSTLYQGVIAGVGSDNRMFVRKAEEPDLRMCISFLPCWQGQTQLRIMYRSRLKCTTSSPAYP